MTIYKVKVPKKTFDFLAFSLLALGAAGGLGYFDHSNHLNALKAYSCSDKKTAEFRPGIAWDNYANEPLRADQDGWALHQEMLEKLNGKNLGQFKNGDKIELFDIKDPKTGKPDGKVLPGDYPK
jgi:hypothetical protein